MDQAEMLWRLSGNIKGQGAWSKELGAWSSRQMRQSFNSLVDNGQ